MRTLFLMIPLWCAIGATGSASALDTLGEAFRDRTFFIRHRSFTPGAPAGWTTTEFNGVAGSDLVNQRAPAVRTILRVSNTGAKDPWPTEPTVSARGTVSTFAMEKQNLIDEKTELERATADVGAEFKDLESTIKFARVDVEVKRLRAETLDDLVRQAEGKSDRADLVARDQRAKRDLVRAEIVAAQLEQTRDAKLAGANEDLRQRLAANQKRLSDLSGFYESDRLPNVGACAKPLVYESADGVGTNPFYPGATEGIPSQTTVAVCVGAGVLQAVYVLNHDGTLVVRSLFGRDQKGRIERIVIRDARGAMIEDHQYLPGPKNTTRFGLTFRTSTNQMTSIYTDLPAR